MATPGVTPRFPFVSLSVFESDAEEAGLVLFDLGASGVEQRDATTLVKGEPGRVTLVGTFADIAAAEEARGAVPAAWRPSVGEVVGDDWRDDWKKHFHPFELVPDFVVRPPWEAYEGAAKHVIVLEPGRAFGTGLHETTSLVATVLATHTPDLEGRDVLDVGCGSGILSIVALTLGAARARAIDVDPDAIAVTLENAAANHLEGRVDADVAPLADVPGRFPVVLANIEAMVLLDLAAALMAHTAPSGLLVLSGILSPEASPDQVPRLREAFRSFAFERMTEKGEWVTLVFRAPP